MKGLLIKDFKLLKMQKNYFFVMIAVAIGMSVLSYDIAFMLGFLTFAISLFTLSTISYDEFDNGNVFLFTLPISRAGYAVEKYCFASLLGIGSWLFATLCAVAVNTLKGIAAFSDIAVVALLILPAMFVIQAVMIPFQLKFGGERGRIAVIGMVGLLVVVGIAVVKVSEMLGIDIARAVDRLTAVSMGAFLLVVIAAALLLLLISMKISIAIMKRKEF